MKVSFTRVSVNRKTGPIPVTMTEKTSCPDSCSFKNLKGCYAEIGKTAIHWNGLGKNIKGTAKTISWNELCDQISILPRKQLWRHNQAGDLPGKDDIIDHIKLNQLVIANARKKAKGFTYTHKPVGLIGQKLLNGRMIYASNRSGFTINLSADNLIEADRLSDFKIAPVVTVLTSDSDLKVKTPNGRHVIVCPAEYNDDIQCINCELCSISNRKVIIGFRAHGSGKNKINKMLKVL